MGTSVYGDTSDDSKSWSVPFHDEIFTQFMFTAEKGGLIDTWMIMNKEQVYGKYSDEYRIIVAASNSLM